MRTRVKMCGTTRLEDALAAVLYGVDALGFILYPKSSRYISPGDAAVISEQLPFFVDRVGVVVNESIENLVKFVNIAGFSCLQFHGDESNHYCRKAKKALPHVRLIKAFRVGKQTREEEFTQYEDYVDGFLLDTYVKGDRGGTGQIFDWSLIAGFNLSRPLILAGGLTSENIIRAISTVHPYGVDINSGVEVRPGEKSHARLREMMGQIMNWRMGRAAEIISL